MALLGELSSPHDSTTPTIFEIIAQERLMPGLRQALKYVLAVGAQRHPRLRAQGVRGGRSAAASLRQCQHANIVRPVPARHLQHRQRRLLHAVRRGRIHTR